MKRKDGKVDCGPVEDIFMGSVPLETVAVDDFVAWHRLIDVNAINENIIYGSRGIGIR